MLGALLKISGLFIFGIVYGKEAKKYSNPLIAVILSLVNIFWILSIILWVSGEANDDTVICAIYSIGYPIIIIIWTIVARTYIKKKSKSESTSIQESKN